MSEQIIDQESGEEDFALDRVQVDAVRAAVEGGDAAELSNLLDPLHAADIADLLEQVGDADRRALLDLWSGGLDGDVLSELDDGVREEVIDYIKPEVLAEAVRDLESDDVVDLVEDLDEPFDLLVLEH